MAYRTNMEGSKKIMQKNREQNNGRVRIRIIIKVVEGMKVTLPAMVVLMVGMVEVIVVMLGKNEALQLVMIRGGGDGDDSGDGGDDDGGDGGADGVIVGVERKRKIEVA